MNVKKELYASLTFDQVVSLEKVALDSEDVYTWIKTIFLKQCFPEYERLRIQILNVGILMKYTRNFNP